MSRNMRHMSAQVRTWLGVSNTTRPSPAPHLTSLLPLPDQPPLSATQCQPCWIWRTMVSSKACFTICQVTTLVVQHNTAYLRRLLVRLLCPSLLHWLVHSLLFSSDEVNYVRNVIPVKVASVSISPHLQGLKIRETVEFIELESITLWGKWRSMHIMGPWCLIPEEDSMVHYVSYKALLVVIGDTSYVLLSPECTSTIVDASEFNVEG